MELSPERKAELAAQMLQLIKEQKKKPDGEVVFGPVTKFVSEFVDGLVKNKIGVFKCLSIFTVLLTTNS